MPTRLPHPVHFVLHYADKWRALIDASSSAGDVPTADALFADIATNEECWILSTYLRLRAKVANVYLTDRPVADAICVVSGLDFGIRDFRLESSYVGTRSDGPAPTLCHLTVVQNEYQASQGAGTFIPHWPQPGLVPCERGRGHRIENMVFYGNEANLDARFRTPAFAQALAERGVRLCMRGGGSGASAHWNDYAEADLVLAVRNLTEADALTKPASKLVNAWLAEVPALLGPEPAFRELRRSELDYFETKTTADALNTLDRLQRDAALYQACIANSLMRAKAFSTDAITAQWIGFLSDEAGQGFEAWRSQGAPRRTATFLKGAAAHKWARSSADKARSAGKRILESP